MGAYFGATDEIEEAVPDDKEEAAEEDDDEDEVTEEESTEEDDEESGDEDSTEQEKIHTAVLHTRALPGICRAIPLTFGRPVVILSKHDLLFKGLECKSMRRKK